MHLGRRKRPRGGLTPGTTRKSRSSDPGPIPGPYRVVSLRPGIREGLPRPPGGQRPAGAPVQWPGATRTSVKTPAPPPRITSCMAPESTFRSSVRRQRARDRTATASLPDHHRRRFAMASWAESGVDEYHREPGASRKKPAAGSREGVSGCEDAAERANPDPRPSPGCPVGGSEGAQCSAVEAPSG